MRVLGMLARKFLLLIRRIKTLGFVGYCCGDLDNCMGSSMAMITGSRSAGPGSVYRIPSKDSGPGPPGL